MATCALALMFLLSAASAAAEMAADLPHVKRIHVEKLGSGEASDQIRDMIIASLQRSGLFVLTEDPDRADAILRGSAEDLIYNETHDVHDGIDARGSVNLGSSSRSGGSSRRSGGMYISSSVGENSSQRTNERRHEAEAAVRLIGRDGDVLWSTIQESRGAKFRGAGADVAEKITRQLVRDYRQRIHRRKPTATPAPKKPLKP